MLKERQNECGDECGAREKTRFMSQDVGPTCALCLLEESRDPEHDDHLTGGRDGTLLILRHFSHTLLFVYFVLHFLLDERFFSAVLFLFFVCSIAAAESTDMCTTRAMSTSEKGSSELIILDDDDDTPQASTSSVRGGLTEEQRKRMAQQKEMALARRRQSLSMGGIAASPSQSRTLQTKDNYDRNGGAETDGHFNAGVVSPYFSPGSSKRSETENRARDDLNYDDQGWRSIRKRACQSFETDVQTSPVKVEGSLDAFGIWREGTCAESPPLPVPKPYGHPVKMEGSLDAFGIWHEKTRAESPSLTVPKPQAPILDWPKPPPKAEVKAKPNDEQMQVLKAIRNGKSVFLTGSAGTGKSFVLEFAIRLLKIVHGADGVYVTASTGLAACALGGTTLHSFAGVGLGNGKQDSLVDKVKSRREVRNRWINARALIVDEISMIDGEFFDKLDYVGRIVRKRSQPFGGIQLIVTGDFYQLPPVNPENPDKYFAFEADCWGKCFDLQIELQTVFRQSDEEFVGMLNEIRRGTCSPAIRQRLQRCSGPVDDDSGVVLTRLYPRKMDVGRENDQNLRALGQHTVVFTAKDEARNEFARKQLDNVRVEPVISLCLGAQVMLAKNLETSVGLVNGARGVVVGFSSPDDPRSAEVPKTARSVNPSGMWPLVRFACDNLERMVGPESWTITEGDIEVAKRTQVPLLLAWALSVHKCQGMTLDRVETDLSRAFDYGMVYVALSRVKSLEGLRLIGFDPSRIRVHPKVTQFYENLGRVTMSKVQ